MSSSFNKELRHCTVDGNSNKKVITRAISNLVSIIPPRSIFLELNSKGLHVRVERENRCLVLTIKYRNFYIVHLSRSDGRLKDDVQKKKRKKCAARVKLHVGQTFFFFFVVVFFVVVVCLSLGVCVLICEYFFSLGALIAIDHGHCL